MHTGSQGDFSGFAGGDQALIKGANERVEASTDKVAKNITIWGKK